MNNDSLTLPTTPHEDVDAMSTQRMKLNSRQRRAARWCLEHNMKTLTQLRVQAEGLPKWAQEIFESQQTALDALRAPSTTELNTKQVTAILVAIQVVIRAVSNYNLRHAKLPQLRELHAIRAALSQNIAALQFGEEHHRLSSISPLASNE